MVLGSSHLLLITNRAALVVPASSHMLLVTNGAVIAGALELTYVGFKNCHSGLHLTCVYFFKAKDPCRIQF